jgi:hypothetical protein
MRQLLLFLALSLSYNNGFAQIPDSVASGPVYAIGELDDPKPTSIIVAVAMLNVQQKKTPQVKKKETRNGTVMAKIFLDNAGNVYHYKVTQGLGKAYDAEAVRLLETLKGKQWAVGNKDGIPVKYFVVASFDFVGKK